MDVETKQQAADELMRDLLKACKAALHLLETDGYETSHHGGEVLTQLRAVVAKVQSAPEKQIVQPVEEFVDGVAQDEWRTPKFREAAIEFIRCRDEQHAAAAAATKADGG